MSRRRFTTLLSAFNTGVFVFLLAPIVVVVVSSFGTTDFLAFPPRGWTLQWYQQALADPKYWETSYVSIWLATVSAVGAVVLGASAAYSLGRYRPPGRAALATFFLSPLVLPSLVLGVALLIFSTQVWSPPGIWRLVVAHVVVTIPYVVRTLLPVVEQLNPALEEAARDLGASAWTATRTINLRLLAPAIVVSTLLAFLVSFDELVLALFLAPPDTPTLPLQIYSNVQFGLDPTVGAVSTLLLTLTAALMLAGQLLPRIRRQPS
jgi:putative spermidine/putrescine transport system permease protein